MKLFIPKNRPAASGFSLVATIMMLALLMILIFAMTTLSSVAVRTAAQDIPAQRARANARLALQLAIGELQRLAGPDGRVTAPSSVTAEEKGQRHLTGVWEGWKWDGKGSAPDWEKEKKSRFKGWLVSTREADAKLDKGYADSLPTGDAVRLVGGSRDIADEVKAEVVKVGGSTKGRAKGGFAWAVFDESQKANISVSVDDGEDSNQAAIERLAAAREPGYEAVQKFDWKALSKQKEQRPLLVTIGQSRHLGLGKKDVPFHDMTSTSRGLLTNVVEGGFAGDLSRLFDAETLPPDFATRFLYSGQDKPLVQPPARFKNATPLPSPDPSWALLHSYYRSYNRLTGGDSKEMPVNVSTLQVRSDPDKPMSSEQILRNPAFNETQIAPVIAKAQFVFSLTFGVNMNTLNNMWSKGSARSSPPSQRDNYITWLVIDPVITLWNPYNVPLRFNEATVELYRIPMAFRLYKNGAKLSENYTRLTDAHTAEDFKTRKNHYYLLKLLPEKGQSSQLMQPGEHIVFTGHQWTKHGTHDYSNYKLGLVMRPGFNPPSGAASSDEIGGVTTQNLFVSPAGVSTGTDYGKTIRTVAVKGGDQIQVEVKPERAGADQIPETGGKEVTGFLKYYVGTKKTDKGEGTERKLIGGIELDYGDKEKQLLPEYSRYDLPTIVVDSAIPKTAPGSSADPDEAGADSALRWKEPFLIATFEQKTERDSRSPSRSWINNGPGNLFSSAGIDEKEDFAHQQYEFKWEPMTDWPPDSPTIEISNERNRGYGGSGIYAQTGTEIATFATLPLAPAHSIGQFSHAPLNVGGQLPLVAKPVGNSFATPLISADKVTEDAGNRTYLDHSYLANNALFDSWFLSSIADHPASGGGKARDAKSLLQNFLAGKKPLPNQRFQPYLGTDSEKDVLALLDDDKEGYKKIGSHLLVEAPFNVNSTSVAAWQAVLASNFGAPMPLADGEREGGDGLPVSRNLPAAGSSGGSRASDQTKWSGYRRLSVEQIASLSTEIVEEVKKRGPFQSLAEFINRRPGSGDTARSGAVQAAIDRAGINKSVIDSQRDFGGATGPNASAGSGNTADGAPGVITQADLLTSLMPQLTARGDTFVVRAYGEASNADGSKVRAWCEATVQRYPGYVDPVDEAYSPPSSEINKTFGRRFQVISFRWLKPQEI